MTGMTRRLSINSMPEVIPVFPLEGALLLPRALQLPLNIFEPRYLAMLDDALKSEQRLIGMVQPRDEASPPALYSIGCAGRVSNFSETDDGRYLIALTGVMRFRVRREIEGFTPYRRCEVDWSPFSADLDTESSGDGVATGQRGEFMALLKRYFAVAQLTVDWEALSRANEETLVNALAMLCPFTPQEKQALLEAPTLEDRRRDLRALMQFIVANPSGGSDLQ